MALRTELGVSEPIVRELCHAVGYIFPAEDAEPEHLFGRQLRLETRGKVFPGRLGQEIFVTALHPIVHPDSLRF